VNRRRSQRSNAVDQPSRIPLWLKLAYTAFVAVLVPVYWINYGPLNFLYFCDVALLVTLVGLWLESPLLISMQAVGIVFPQMLWIGDVICGLVGFFPLGLTKYMFDEKLPLFLRLLSLFHGWLPLLLLWLVWRMGYVREAFRWQVLLGWVLLTVCYLWTPPPPAPADNPSAACNINYVFAFPWDESKPQEAMPSLAWFAILLVFFPVCVFLPAHLALIWLNQLRPKPAVFVPPDAGAALPPRGARSEAADDGAFQEDNRRRFFRGRNY
jgi:hypothetical protein